MLILSMTLEALPVDAITSSVDKVKTALENPIISAVAGGVGGLGVGLAIGSALGSGSSSSKKRKKSRSGRARDRRFKSKQKHEQRYKRKRPYKVYKKKGTFSDRKKSKSRRGIHYTKNGQPYKIMSNGRARFIKRR